MNRFKYLFLKILGNSMTLFLSLIKA